MKEFIQKCCWIITFALFLAPFYSNAQNSTSSLLSKEAPTHIKDAAEDNRGSNQMNYRGGCDVTMTPGATLETEACGDDENGGCNSTPEAYQDIETCTTVFGTAWYDGSTRDTDWYRFTIGYPADVTYTGIAEFEAFFALVDISDCGAPAVLGSGSVVAACSTGTETITLGAGTYVMFGSPQFTSNVVCGTLDEYEMSLSISPVNDTCANAIALSSGDVVNGNTDCATVDTEPTCVTGDGTGGGVWYTYTPSTDEIVTASLCNSDYDTKIRVFTGTCGSLVCETGNDDACSLQSEASWCGSSGTTYYILVHGFGSATGDFELELTTSTLTNDDVCDATALSFGSNGPFNNACATAQSGEAVPPGSGCNTNSGWCSFEPPTVDNSLWFTFTAPASGNVTIETDGFDTQLAVYEASACGDLTSGGATLLAANDDGGPGFASFIDSLFCLTPGATYWVQVDGYNGASGDFTVDLTDVGYVADATITPASPFFCEGGDVTLSAPTGAGFLYDWSPSGETTQSITVDTEGNVTLTVTDTNNCVATNTVFVDEIIIEPVILADGELCPSGSVTLTTANTYSGYSWAPNGETTQSITVSSPGTYTVTVTDANGCTGTASYIVEEVSTTFTGLNSDYCVDDAAVALTGSPLGGTFSGTGITGDGNAASASVSGTPIAIPTNETELDVSLTPSGVPGTALGTDQNLVSVCMQIEHTWVGDVRVTLTSPNGTEITLMDRPGDPASFDGCSGDDVDVTIVPGTGNDMEDVCNPATPTIQGTFTAHDGDDLDALNDGSDPNGTWTITLYDAVGAFDDGDLTGFTLNFGTTGEFDPSTAGAGTHDITYTYETCDGCVVTETQSVTVHDLPEPEITADGPLCSGQSVTLTSTAADSYLWSPGGETTQSITVNSSGIYSVTVTDANGCEGTASITVVESPVPSVSFSGLNGPYCANDGPVTLTGTPAGGTFSGDGVTDSGNGATSSATGLPVSIPDDTPAGVDITHTPTGIPGTALGVDQLLNSVCLKIDHTWVGDLIVTLTSPNGTTITLVDRPGIPATTFGCSGDNISAVFIPGTGSDVENVCNTTPPAPAISGLFTAQSPDDLASLNDGSDPNGTWTLNVSDNAGADFGEVTLFSLNFGNGIGVWDPSEAGTGTHDITYTYETCEGCVVESTQSVTVNVSPTPTITPDGSTDLCPGEDVTLTASAATSYSWSPNGETIQAITVSSAGTYSVEVTYANGCTNTSADVTVTENTAPSPPINADGPTEICEGDDVTFSTDSYNSYSWSPNGETTQSITVDQSGTYSVTVTDANGCTGTSADSIVTVNPVPTNDSCANATPVTAGNSYTGSTVCATYDDAPFCGTSEGTGGGVWFTYTGNDEVVTASLCNSGYDTKIRVYTGSCGALECLIGNDDACNLQSEVSWCGLSGETYYILVHGFSSATGDYELEITEGGTPPTPPAPTISGPTVICDGSPITLTASDAVAYAWAPNGETTQSIEVTSPGTYEVEITDVCGGTNTNFVEVTQGGGSAQFTGLNTTYDCTDAATTLIGTPAGGTWSGPGITNNGNAASASLQTPVDFATDEIPFDSTLTPGGTIPGTALGTDQNLVSVCLKIEHTWVGDIRVELTSPNGTTVTLLDQPGAPASSFGCDGENIDVTIITGTGSDMESVCNTTIPTISGTYTAHDGDDLASLNDGSDPNGTWTVTLYDDFGSLDFGAITELTLNFGTDGTFDPAAAGSGTFDVVYTVNFCDGCTATETKTVTVNGPEADFTYNQNGLSVDFTDASTGSPVAWEWDFDDGSGLETSQNPTHTYNQDGTYDVTLVVEDASGCTDTTEQTITIITTDIEEEIIGLESLDVYPNPTNGEVIIEFLSDGMKDLRIEVVNVIGQKLYTEQVGEFTGQYRRTVDLGNYARGTYILQIFNDRGMVTKRIIRQ